MATTLLDVAMASGVEPRLSRVLTSAPAAISNLIFAVAAWGTEAPLETASIKAVRPSWSLALGLARADNKTWSTSGEAY